MERRNCIKTASLLTTGLGISGLAFSNITTKNKKETMDDKIVKLELKDVLKERKAQYCRYIDTKQFDQWAKLFTTDAKITFYNVDGTVQVAFPNIKAFIDGTIAIFSTTQTVHQTHNAEIVFTSPKEASVIYAMEDWHIYKPVDGNPSKTRHGYGFYYETWKLVDDEWLLDKMDLKRTILTLT